MSLPEGNPIIAAMVEGKSPEDVERIARANPQFINIGNTNPDTYSAFTYAIREWRYHDVAANLLRSKLVDVCAFNSLEKALAYSNYELAAEILRVPGIEKCVSSNGSTGYTPFYWTCYHHRAELAAAMLDLGVDVALPLEAVKSNNDALINASRGGYGPEMVAVAMRILASKHADPAAVNGWKQTALMCACDSDTDETVELAMALLDLGAVAANIAQVDINGNTALMYACQNSVMTDVALRLIEMSVPLPMSVDKETGDTALIMACKSASTDVALALIATGRSMPEHVNNEGKNAAAIAAENGLLDVVDELRPLAAAPFAGEELGAPVPGVAADPSRRLVVFHNCRPNERCSNWKSDMKKKTKDNMGCALNVLSYLEVISGSLHEELLRAMDSDSGTSFEQIANLVAAAQGKPAGTFTENIYKVNTAAAVRRVFGDMLADDDDILPRNACTICKFNGGADKSYGHSAIMSKGTDGTVYIVDPIYNRIRVNNLEILTKWAKSGGYVTVSFMFEPVGDWVETAVATGAPSKRRRVGGKSRRRRRCVRGCRRRCTRRRTRRRVR